MKYAVDQDACIGCGMCEALCSKVFAIGLDGKAQAVKESTSDNDPAASEAMASCPVGAIFQE